MLYRRSLTGSVNGLHPHEAVLVAVFDHKALGSGSRTQMLAHAFIHFRAQEDEAAVHLALPRDESLLRA